MTVMTKCELCEKVVEFLVEKVAVGGTCLECEILVGAAFTAAEAFFVEQPEAEPVFAALEIVFEAAFSEACNEFGVHWIKKNTKKFSKDVCKKAKLC
jgi:hypothetical protein